jgi:hypothetical protein
MEKQKRVLLPPDAWWVGKKNGVLLAMMFGRMTADGNVSVEWEVLDESNLPVDFVRRDGEEYSFVFPVGLNGSPVQEEGTDS